MYKKLLSGVLAAAMVVGGAAYAAQPQTAADAASAPKPKYTFSMNGASKKVVGVARKGDTASGGTGKTKTGVLPTANKKAKLQYKKGKHGKALYISRTVGGKAASMGAELKGVKLGNGSWTVSSGFQLQRIHGLITSLTLLQSGHTVYQMERMISSHGMVIRIKKVSGQQTLQYQKENGHTSHSL